MQRIKNLHGYQKGLLLLLLAMVLVFAVVYHMTIARVGVLYQNAIFVPAEENGVTVYSGKLRGKQAEFTVSADKTVSFRCDGQTYGCLLYTSVLSDGTVVPCCLDHEGDIPLGNLFSQNLPEILDDTPAKLLLSGFFAQKLSHPLCRRCGYAKRFR